MSRTFAWFVAAGVCVFACASFSEDDPPTPPGTPGPDDGGSSGNVTPGDSGGTTNDASQDVADGGDPCDVPPSPTPNGGASSGGPGCVTAADCTVRYYGDYCCPRMPQAMTNGAATFFDEARNGASQECRDRCTTVRCAAPPTATAVCTKGLCVLQ